MPDDVHLIKEVQALRARRLLRTLAVVQDLSDALMAVNDVTGGHPVTLLLQLASELHHQHRSPMLWPAASRPPFASNEPANCFFWPMQHLAPCSHVPCHCLQLETCGKLSGSAIASTSNAQSDSCRISAYTNFSNSPIPPALLPDFASQA